MTGVISTTRSTGSSHPTSSFKASVKKYLTPSAWRPRTKSLADIQAILTTGAQSEQEQVSAPASAQRVIPRLRVHEPDPELDTFCMTAAEDNRIPIQTTDTLSQKRDGSPDLHVYSVHAPSPDSRDNNNTSQAPDDYASFLSHIEHCATDLSDALRIAWKDHGPSNPAALAQFAELREQLVQLETLCTKARRSEDTAIARAQLLLCASNAAMAVHDIVDRRYAGCDDDKTEKELASLNDERDACWKALQPSVASLKIGLGTNPPSCTPPPPPAPRAFPLVCKSRCG